MAFPLIAAHRGVMGGNIPCNCFAGYEAALTQGADIIELDVSKSLDGTLFVFHPGLEPVWLGSEKLIRDMHDEEARALRLYNADHTPTDIPLRTLDEALEQLKGRCLVNIDKFPLSMREIAQTVRRHGMTDDVLVKTNAGEEWFRAVEEIAPDLPYMVFARHEDGFSETLKGRRLNYRGTEVIFPDDTCEVGTRAYVERMHRLGLKVWVNAILYDYRKQLSGGHTDDAALAGDPDFGWGRLIDLGVDMIQTDWPGMLYQYMHARERSRS